MFTLEYDTKPPPQFDYRFSINDFQTDQLNHLKEQCLAGQGNDNFKEKLFYEMEEQRRERAKFYKVVQKKRLKNISSSLYSTIFEKLHLPPTWLSIFRKKQGEEIKFTPKRWQPPEDINAVVSKVFPEKECMAALQPGSTNLTGFERLKRAFLPRFFVPNFSKEESSHIFNSSLFWSYVRNLGMCVGLVMAFSYGKRYMHEFDRTAAGNMYYSETDVHRARYDSFLKGYARYAFRWGWRFAFIFGGMYFISQCLAIYRLKESPVHYVAAATIPLALYKWTRGPKGMLVYGTLGGIFIGLPLSLVFCGLNFSPRAAWYNASVMPEVSSRYHWHNWTDDQWQINEIRMKQLLEELRTNREYFDPTHYENLIPNANLS